jgi:hypothetical protein
MSASMQVVVQNIDLPTQGGAGVDRLLTSSSS